MYYMNLALTLQQTWDNQDNLKQVDDQLTHTEVYDEQLAVVPVRPVVPVVPVCSNDRNQTNSSNRMQ